MSFEDLLEQTALEHDAEQKKAWRKNPKFQAIEGISKEDLFNGSAYIEKLKWPPWDKRNNSAQKEETSLTIGYGKYAAKTFEWVKENDSRYFEWMLQNVPKFAAKVKQLGLS